MEEHNCRQITGDNPNLDCLIVVGTKAWVRADVWGDAAGTAPAVTSVRALAFDRFRRYPEPLKSSFKRISWFARFVYSDAVGVFAPSKAEFLRNESVSLDCLRELAGIV